MKRIGTDGPFRIFLGAAFLAAIVLTLPGTAATASGPTPPSTQPAEAQPQSTPMSEALRLLEQGDTFAAIAYLDGLAPAAAADAYHELMLHLYWQKKDLPSCVAVARAGVQHCLSAARRAEAADAELAERLRGKAKGLCYDMASFTWPG